MQAHALLESILGASRPSVHGEGKRKTGFLIVLAFRFESRARASLRRQPILISKADAINWSSRYAWGTRKFSLIARHFTLQINTLLLCRVQMCSAGGGREYHSICLVICDGSRAQVSVGRTIEAIQCMPKELANKSTVGDENQVHIGFIPLKETTFASLSSLLAWQGYILTCIDPPHGDEAEGAPHFLGEHQ